MNAFRNMKIRSKLLVGFLAVLLITVFIAGYAVIQLQSTSAGYTYVMRGPQQRQNIARDIEVAMMDARRIMNRASMSASESADRAVREAAVAEQAALLAILRSEIVSLSAAFRANLNADDTMPALTRSQQLNRIEQVERLAIYYIDHYVSGQIFPLARDGESYQVIIVTRSAVNTVNDFNRYLGEILGAMNEVMANHQQSLAERISATTGLMILIAGIGVLIGIVVALLIANSVSKPVNEVLNLVKHVSGGNLNINMNRAALTTDEVGMLTADIYNMIDVIKCIMADLGTFTREANDNGDIEYRMDAHKYRGDYASMVRSINDFADVFVRDMMVLIGVLDNIGAGEFDIKISQMPGKKAVVNDKVEVLVRNLGNINEGINAMIQAAADRGDLAFHIDVAKFQGDWRKIMEGLNHIAEAVDAPIVEIRDIMNKLAVGDFSSKVTGNYVGDFLQMKTATNATIDALSATIAEVSQVLSQIADGNLGHSINREYLGEFAEIKNSINHIGDTLRKSMGEIASAADYVLEGAKRITTNAMELADGSATQAASLEELNTSVELINIQTRQFAENASEANKLSNRSTANAQEGNDAMKQMLGAMMGIREASNSISTIIKVIQDIAFQTNLLSLNAAVEAARAGEHGKGFGVVAEEVRSLAARSQDAAAETTTLIQDSISRVESGAAIANTTSESLDTIVANATEVLLLIENITSAANEQADMISQISSVLLETANTVQNNSKFAQEAAATAEELNAQSETLQQLVSYFKI